MAGTNIVSEGGLIGHLDPLEAAHSSGKSKSGDTFVASGRTTGLPFSGSIITTQGPGGTEARFTSAWLGNVPGHELRLYTPNAADNSISDGTILNDATYSRTVPGPVGSGRADEQIAAESLLTVGPDGEPVGTFGPAGDFPVNGVGRYNIYYAEQGVATPPAPPVPPAPVPPVPNFLSLQQQLLATGFILDVTAAETLDEETYLYYTDAFGNVYLVGLALDDVVYEQDPDGSYYYTLCRRRLWIHCLVTAIR